MDNKKKASTGKRRTPPVRKINKMLIANRGEIVLRINKACRALGIMTAALYTTNDHNKMLNHAVDDYAKIEGDSIAHTLLNTRKLMKAAKKLGCDALHPGYGFLAEDPLLAEACEKENILFIGPSSKALRNVAGKLDARNLAKEAGLDVIESSRMLTTAKDAAEFARQEGYPIVLKSCTGGGGRGIRVVNNPQEIQESFEDSMTESIRTSGRNQIFAEKHIQGRHIEIQFIADKHGNALHLYDRECSIQRRHQKLIEEAPSPLSKKMKDEYGKKVCSLALKAGYAGAGTVEFLWTPEGRMQFLEINPRIQVEHGVTEMVTGVDIVIEQIRTAQGHPLSIRQHDIKIDGHAIECRIIAENARDGFSPSRGSTAFVDLTSKPDEETAGHYRLRIETALYQGIHIQPQYDSLMAKVMVWAKDRRSAVKGMRDALTHLRIEGVPNTLCFCKTLMNHPDMKKGNLSTDFIKEKGLVEQYIKKTLAPDIVAAIATAIYEKEYSHKLLDEELDNWTKRAIEESFKHP